MWNMKDLMNLVLIISNLNFIAWKIATLYAIYKNLVKDAKNGEEK